MPLLALLLPWGLIDCLIASPSYPYRQLKLATYWFSDCGACLLYLLMFATFDCCLILLLDIDISFVDQCYKFVQIWLFARHIKKPQSRRRRRTRRRRTRRTRRRRRRRRRAPKLATGVSHLRYGPATPSCCRGLAPAAVLRF